jgi:hypothetical protein
MSACLALEEAFEFLVALHIYTSTLTTIYPPMAGINAGDAKLVFESSEEVKIAPTFDALGLKDDLLRGECASGR